MRAYMKDVAPFLGLTTPDRRALSRTVLLATAAPAEADCTAVALRCWALPEREYHYFAVDYLRRHVRQLSSAFLPVARHLVGTVSWWDTVDALASHVVGGLVAADAKLKSDMDAWIEDDDQWVARTALLHQLRYKETTDTERLTLLSTAVRTSRLLRPQGDRLVSARAREDGSGGGTGLRRPGTRAARSPLRT